MKTLFFSYFGELASLGAALCWAIGLTIYRKYGEGIAPLTMTGLKNLVGLTLFALALAFMHPENPADLETSFFLLVSGMVGITISDTALFAGLRRVGTTVTTLTFCLTPPLTSLFGWVLFGEVLSRNQWLGMVLTLGSLVGITMTGTHSHFRSLSKETKVTGLTYLLLAQVSNVMGMLLVRDVMPRTQVLYATFLRMAGAGVLLVPILIWNERFLKGKRKTSQGLTRKNVPFLVLASLIGTVLGVVCFTAGLKFTKTGVAASLNSTTPIWAIPIAKLVSKETATVREIAFTTLAVIGIFLMFLA